MKLVSLTAACVFISAVAAFAGSDHYNADQINRPPTALDSTHTSSIIESIGAAKASPTVRKPVTNDMGSRDHWGR
ncbi:DUF680 domain-containing protein [Mesorhizobium sp. CU2]|uniref:DUF680 domain-containing protein n=1 Tax=unclassified Mesorhizobium TaxID=325217 RepID=UPI001125DCBE|nr:MULTISPECIES: DUF680 domain-containing protein [unclassified Mesorhizobium]TPN83249.1 DUF680 domain-containing protein [Mesorhizobium sp. CU3]TPO15875.1 DUF680 domain-containing protein [Mesorhizobium sp. CU2]